MEQFPNQTAAVFPQPTKMWAYNGAVSKQNGNSIPPTYKDVGSQRRLTKKPFPDKMAAAVPQPSKMSAHKEAVSRPNGNSIPLTYLPSWSQHGLVLTEDPGLSLSMPTRRWCRCCLEWGRWWLPSCCLCWHLVSPRALWDWKGLWCKIPCNPVNRTTDNELIAMVKRWLFLSNWLPKNKV